MRNRIMKFFIASLWIYSLVLTATAEDGLNRLSTAEAEAGRELLFTCPDSAVAEEVRRPNILWIIAEDMSPDLGCYGNKVVTTPNIDVLAAKGMKFRIRNTKAPSNP